MSKKVKMGPYMIKDGIVAKTRPWKKLNVPALPEKMAREYPDGFIELVCSYDDISEENAMREACWKWAIRKQYRAVRHQHIVQQATKRVVKVKKAVKKVSDFTYIVRQFSGRVRNDG